jgi:hypothetical protein
MNTGKTKLIYLNKKGHFYKQQIKAAPGKLYGRALNYESGDPGLMPDGEGHSDVIHHGILSTIICAVPPLWHVPPPQQFIKNTSDRK